MDRSDLAIALKTLWGAGAMPFGSTVNAAFTPPNWQQIYTDLGRYIHLRISGVLHGPNGVGKTVLVDTLIEGLPEKLFAPVRIVHTSLTGSDLLRTLCLALGIEPAMRRSDNVAVILRHWQSLGGRQALVVVDEAQNLAAPVLEELRLLGCGASRLAGSDRRWPFGLLLVGDNDLLPRLQLGINRPLLSRLSFCLALPPLPPQAVEDYINARWAEVGVRTCPFQPQAVSMLAAASAGVPRTINNIALLAIARAAAANRPSITSDDVAAALTHLPWLGSQQDQPR